ncbi:substrate-binding periplasmic protein [Micromonospora krabiensis]|uniref:ABC-type amino acid transport substrate-binding protein n=1 Tax=Micromonospora krabiensis TaxID=307121 RepID=A0A1C3N1Z3_9ACTN|nr:transporter substrate-binding domain-containing protein [Micromonospora krabiensis]SBV26571.1 ABC-type amino acid transport substrate-binding protein [Micromonospora krabiensis]
MTRNPRRASTLLRPLRVWGPVVALIATVLAAAAIVAVGVRASPISPSRPVLVSSGDWAPFVGADLPAGGPMTELVVEVLTRCGYRPEVRYASSWALTEEQLGSGASIGMFPLVGSESRRDRFLLSDRLIDFEYVLFYDRREGEPRVSSAADLSALRVGGVAGYDYWDELESAVPGMVRFDSTVQGFRALVDGRIDVLAEGLLSGQAALTDPSLAADAGDFGYLRGDDPLVHSVEGLYFMMPNTPEAATVMRQFNRVLAQMRQSEEYEEIVAELEPAATQEVTLTPTGASGLVELLDEKGDVLLLAPRGTRARVIRWPDAFVDTAGGATPSRAAGGAGTPGGTAGRILVPVKVTNGPAQGRALYVDARALLLTPEGP